MKILQWFLSGNFQPFLAFKLFDPDNRKKKLRKQKLLILGCYRFIILSNNRRFSPFLDPIIVLTQPTLPADRTRGGVVAESDNRKLSDKLRTLYKPV